MTHVLLRPFEVPSGNEQKLNYLLDRLAVTDVFNRFFLALDFKDWETAGTCLTDPFTMLVDGGKLDDPTLTGSPVQRDEWLKALEERNGGWLVTLHIHPNELVVINGDRATLGSYQVVPHAVGLQEGENYTTWGFYDVELVRREGAWLMEKLVVRPLLANNVNVPEIYRRARLRAESLGEKTIG